MMITPEANISQFEEVSYKEMIKERDGLIRYICHYEKLEKAGDRTGEEWMICPSPDVRYQMYLEYLSEPCAYMKERYNQEHAWGDKKLSDGK